MDIGYEYRKEIKILNNACDQSTLVSIFQMLELTPEQIEIKSAKIIHNLVENEGIAEVWAKRICLAFLPVKINKTVGYEKEEIDAIPSSKTAEEVENEMIVDMESPSFFVSTEEKNAPPVSIKAGDRVKFAGQNWLVLDVKFEAALILSEKDYSGSFHDKDRPVNWKGCDLRKYLNAEFYQNQFNDDEKKNILTVKNVTMQKHGPLETNDSIFCLCKRDVDTYFDILIKNRGIFGAGQFLLRNNGDHDNYIMTMKRPDFAKKIFVNEYGVFSSYNCNYKVAMWVKANILKQ